jgi:hypothetical protein
MAGPSDEILDVAVVGAGAGGAYTAYRLMNAQPGDSPTLDALRGTRSRLNVALFEEGSRIGGRLWSHRDPTLPEMPMELGGQGFSELQQNVYGLCTKELSSDLTVVDCPAFSLGPQLQYQRRHRFPYKAYSPMPPDTAALVPLTPQGRATLLRAWRAFIVQFCPAVPPLPEPLDQQTLAALVAWCTSAEAAVQAVTDYYPNIVPYFLMDGEKYDDPFTLLLDVILSGSSEVNTAFVNLAAEVQKNGASSTAFTQMNELQSLLRTVKTADGQTLDTHGFWNVFATRVSSEAYNMTGSASFASSSMGNWNLYDSSLAMIVGTLMYMMSTPFYSIQQGYDQLPAIMLRRFQAAGGRLMCGYRVLDVGVDNSSGQPMVALTVGPSDSGTASSTVLARYAILALPKCALGRMDMAAFNENPGFRSDVASVQPVRASKVFMVYPEPWWQRTPGMQIQGGYSTTDLPVRACYYMGARPDGRSLVLTSLNDQQAETFWAGYEDPPILPGRGGPLPPPGLPKISKQQMTDQLQKQLWEMHGFEIPEPVAGPIYFNWDVEPFGGGWHNWRPGLKSWEVMPRIRRMSVGPGGGDPRVFLCGEAWSNQQGWVEGALNTAEMVLETYFGLSRPDWVASTYDFGP